MIPQELITTEESKFHIPADAVNFDDRVKVLNHFDTFAIFDRWGDVFPHSKKAQGIFHYGTRFINKLELRVNGIKPLLLSSSIKEDNDILSVDLTNPDLSACNIMENTLHISRSQFVRNGIYYEEIKFVNYGEKSCHFDISLSFDADFKDIFEVRGIVRNVIPPKPQLQTSNKKICFQYKGLDNINRETVIDFSDVKSNKLSIQDKKAQLKIDVKPHDSFVLHYNILFKTEETFFGLNGEEKYKVPDAKKQLSEQVRKARLLFAEIHTSNNQFNHWIHRSKADLLSLLTETAHGKYPYAGVPWYNTAFGRDGIITAMEVLWIAPEIAKDALQFLSKMQAKELIPAKDAEPGKILHEARTGEMANTGEIPFREYYGTIDATPLFIMLAGMYYHRTADIDTIKKIWPNIKASLLWIEKYGDLDGDGYVEYKHKAENGLTNQGWKDSHDSVMYKDGKLCEPPIALCEVQGYVYGAKKWAAELADALDDKELSNKLSEEAAVLKANFNKDFWDDELKCFVLALDGNKKPCRVVSSNAGHCLFTGIVDDDKVKELSATLLNEDMFSGWGIRTLSAKEVRYNPISYHNGSIWPHDNALIAYGMAKYQLRKQVQTILQSLFDASLFIELQRLPELFCGFERRSGEGPTAYPVACSPQAWSVATVYFLMQACLQIEINALQKQVVFNRPLLPKYLEKIVITNLKLGNETCNIEIYRHEYDVAFNVQQKPEDWEVLIRK
jgi:glycogen debranching enzyme